MGRTKVALLLNVLMEGSRWCRQHRTLQVLGGSSTDLPSSGGGSPDKGYNKSSLHSTIMRTSRGRNNSAHAGRGLWVKVDLSIFKDEKGKNMVTYHSWQGDVANFHWSGLDDQHLLPYIFCSLQGFLGDLARSIGKDATLRCYGVLQMLDGQYDVIIAFNALSKEFYSLKQGLKWGHSWV